METADSQRDLFTALNDSFSAEYLLDSWRHFANADTRELVIPDGCQDLIISCCGVEKPRHFISELSKEAYLADLKKGVHMIGFRLKPGTHIDQHHLTDFIDKTDIMNVSAGSLDEFCQRTAAIDEALECLGSGINSVADASRQLGVSVRTLQRTVKHHTGVTPQFWLALSRVRRSSRSLHYYDSLADAAHNFGYADQSHMTREVKRWLGTTPAHIRTNTELYARLIESGYC